MAFSSRFAAFARNRGRLLSAILVAVACASMAVTLWYDFIAVHSTSVAVKTLPILTSVCIIVSALINLASNQKAS